MKFLKKAEMLPNFIVRLVFDNKEVRYYNLKRAKLAMLNIGYLVGQCRGWVINL